MKNEKNKLRILFSIFLLIMLLSLWSFSCQTHEAKSSILTEIYPSLQNSIKLYVEHKAKKSYYATQYKYDPNKGKIGEYETRTAKFGDTTFVYQRKIIDPGAAALRTHQTIFLETNQLHADSIQIILDSLLQEKNIYVHSIVGVTTAFRAKKDEWSGDTTAIDINYRTSFTKQGEFEHINYYVYIHFSKRSLWILMDKTPICIFFIFNLIIGFSILWRWRKYKKHRINGIEKMKNGNYRIKSTLYNTKDKLFISDKKEVSLTYQLHSLLLLFLEAKNHRIEKREVKDILWPKHINPLTNMTSTINRLNNKFKEVECPYIIVTDSINENYYILTDSS